MDYDVSKAFKRIENRLIDSMMRNLSHHRAEELAEGYNWAQWQILQLAELEKYRKTNPAIFAGDFVEINARTKDALNTMYQDAATAEEARILKQVTKGNIDVPAQGAVESSFFGINEGRFVHMVQATEADFARGEWSMLRQANDTYRKTIFDAQMYAANGATYEQAVDMATKDFLKQGIQCITYKNGARHTMQDYASMALRTGQKRAYLMGEGDVHDKYGIHTVRVNKRLNACPLCVGWLGKVLIDDVYAGGTAQEAIEAGVPLLSEAMDQGFLHPNCKDIYSLYIEGVSKPADPWTKEEIQEITDKYNVEEAAKHAEDMAESYDRMAKYSLDDTNKARYQARADEWQNRLDMLNSETPTVPVVPTTPAQPPATPQIKFADNVSEAQREIITTLAEQYDARVVEVLRGTEHGAGEADAVSGILRLSSDNPQTTLHEFAHMIASERTDKLGITDNTDFWKEIKKIHMEYKKDVDDDVSRWISSYEHSSKGHGEFLAEAFTQAKMRELGLEIPKTYGKDFTYSQRVLDTVEKYFGKRRSTAKG